MIDLHNHILPGLDDGAETWEESLEMARMAFEDGITGVVCTPHWSAGVYENSRSAILKSVRLFAEKLHERNIPLELYPGSELRLDPGLIQKIQSREILTLNDNGAHALLELPDIFVAAHMDNFLWQLCSQGITPILAHPERHLLIQRQPERLSCWIRMGALVQVTGASLLGHFGKFTRDVTVQLVEHRMVHIVATDAHGVRRRAPRLAQARHEIVQLAGEEQAHLLTCETPRKILAGASIQPHQPLPISGTTWWKKLVRFWS
jgi:protein-tyrosine phosphatase